jgi:threonine dehydratase
MVSPTARALPDLIDAAAARIHSLVLETPLEAVDPGGPVPAESYLYAKLETRQKTGSFKFRGATNKLMSLAPEAASAGVVASSTGNHGLGVAAAAKALGVPAEVFVCTAVAEAKRDAIRAHGARVSIVGDDPLAAELAARAAALESGRSYVSPYNDVQVIAGQGTIGVELVRQLPGIDAVFIATGGGGLMSGVGAYLRVHAPRAEVIGCWPENSAVLYHSLRAGALFDVPESPTVSDSTAGGVEADSITFELCREVMHRGVLVSEADIWSAMHFGHARGWPMEGASGVALAAYFGEAARWRGRRVVVLLCGGNASPAVRARLVAGR